MARAWATVSMPKSACAVADMPDGAARGVVAVVDLRDGDPIGDCGSSPCCSTLARDDREILLTPAGGLPVLLVLLGVAGMAWADVSLSERWGGLGSYFKLLFIPLLFVHFRRSGRGMAVFAGYALSCIVLLLLSYVVAVMQLKLTHRTRACR